MTASIQAEFVNFAHDATDPLDRRLAHPHN
jgi:hypothetical protein